MKNTLFVSYEFAPLQIGRTIQSLTLTRERIALIVNKCRAVITIVTAYLAGITNNSAGSQREIDKNIKPSISTVPIRIDWLLNSSIAGKLNIINPKPAAL